MGLIAFVFKKHIAQIQAQINLEKSLLQDTSANFLGVESRGEKQIRGNGYLVLFPDRIQFWLHVPRLGLITILEFHSMIHEFQKKNIIQLDEKSSDILDQLSAPQKVQVVVELLINSIPLEFISTIPNTPRLEKRGDYD